MTSHVTVVSLIEWRLVSSSGLVVWSSPLVFGVCVVVGACFRGGGKNGSWVPRCRARRQNGRLRSAALLAQCSCLLGVCAQGECSKALRMKEVEGRLTCDR